MSAFDVTREEEDSLNVRSLTTPNPNLNCHEGDRLVKAFLLAKSILPTSNKNVYLDTLGRQKYQLKLVLRLSRFQ